MKTSTLFNLLLCIGLTACGNSSEAKASDAAAETSSAASAELVTDPQELPSDEAGLAGVYENLLERVVTTLEGVETKEQLKPALDKIASFGPAYQALMARSEELGLAVDGTTISAKVDDLVARMQTAMQGLVKSNPTKAMEIMNAFTGMTGGVEPK